ncbi:MAG: fimbria/pilus periplasmic chaperone [Alphaproteobacteria bacterium]
MNVSNTQHTRIVYVLKLFGVALFLCMLSFPAFAVKIFPQNQVIELTKSLNAELTVENTREEPVTLEFYIKKRDVQEDGKEKYEDVTDDFIIFPPQALISPGQSQKVRIQYAGDTALQQSRSYHIFSEEVLVNFDDNPVQGIRPKMRIGVSLHVLPQGVDHAVSVRDVILDDSQAKITVINEGTSFAYLDNARITLRSDDKERVFEGIELVKLAARTLLEPVEGIRTFSLPLPEGASGDHLSASIEMIEE